MTTDQAPCAECGQHPSDRRATKNRRWHGGNRFAFRVWVVLLFASLVLAMPWVQTKLGWRMAEMDHTDLRDPRPRVLPMIDPLVRWRDVQAAAQGDPEAIALLREGISESMTLTHSARDAEHITLRVDMVQNEYDEHGSRNSLRRFYDDDSANSRRQFWYIRDSNEFTGYGWPYSWHRQFRTRLIDYQEVVYSSNPMGVDPEPISTVEYDYFERWSWTGIVASIALAWWAGWLAAIILRKLGAKRSVCTAGRWCVVVGMLSTSLILGLNPTTKETKSRFSTAHEMIPAQIVPRARSVDEMHELISDDKGVRQIAQRLVGRHNTLDRPNALVGLITLDPVQLSIYSMRIGYWGESGIDYSRTSRFAVDEDGNATPVSRNSSQQKTRFHFSIRGMSLHIPADSPSDTRYLIRVDFAMLLAWLTAMAILLRLLELAIHPLYRRSQRRRARRGLCIWCKYPVSSNA